CGLPLAELTASARGALNRATKELRDLHATPAEVHRRATAYRATYRGATLTPSALAKHWPSLNGQHDPDRVTTADLDRICPLVEPTEEDLAWLAQPDPMEGSRHV